MKRDTGKVKTEFLVLGLVILSLAVILMLSSRDRVSYNLPDIPALEPGVIDRVEVESKLNKLVLERSENKWRMKKSGYTVDDNKIDQVLSTLRNLKVTTLVSQSGDFRRYGLDPESSISVRAFSSDREVRSLVVGKVASTYRHTFVRFPNDSNVYHADESIRSRFEHSLGDWRDKEVLTFESSEISDFSILVDGKQATFSRSVPEPSAADEGETAPESKTKARPVSWRSSLTGTVSTEKVDALLNSLSKLSCQDFTPERAKNTINPNALKVTLNGNRDYILAIASEKEGETEIFPAYSANADETFLLASYTANELIRKAKALIEKEDDPDSGKKKAGEGSAISGNPAR